MNNSSIVKKNKHEQILCIIIIIFIKNSSWNENKFSFFFEDTLFSEIQRGNLITKFNGLIRITH